MSNQPQPEASIYSNVKLTKNLIDVRIGRYGQTFGTVENLCKQYGIKCIQHPNGMEFTAPKTRLQLFMEALHFSKTKYSKKL
jgi:hypothetical protein